jgi:molybdate transport system substrate-binding protein
MHRYIVGVLVLLVLAHMTASTAAQSGERGRPAIQVISSTGLKAVFDELVPQFERSTGYTVTVKYGPSAVLKQEIDRGTPFDLTVLTPALLDDLVKQGKVVAATKRSIARAGMAIAVRAGARRPDIATTDALKRTLLEAKSLAYAKEGAAGIYFAALASKLQITDGVKSKSLLTATGEQVGQAVARGEAELGILPLSEILPVAGIEVLGPFPPEVQDYAVMVGAVSADARESAGARRLIEFVTAPAAAPVIQKKGMEPVK